MDISNFVNNSLPTLIGVVVGGIIGLLSPLIDHRLQQRKRKSDLKSSLMRNLYIFYNLHKAQLRSYNTYDYFFRRVSFARQASMDANHPENRTEYLELAMHDEDRRSEALKSVNELFLLLIEREAELVKLKYEIGEMYSKDSLKSVASLIDPIIKKAGDVGNFQTMDLSKLADYNQLVAVDAEFQISLTKRIADIQRECDNKISEFATVLK